MHLSICKVVLSQQAGGSEQLPIRETLLFRKVDELLSNQRIQRAAR